MAYEDEQINEFLGVAQEIGIGRAMRQLGFPSSWSTAQRWAKMRGIEVAVDELKAKAAQTREWYKEEDVKEVAQLGMNRIYEDLMHNDALTSDDKKKLGEAFNKFYQVWANVQGKATQINETRQPDGIDLALQEMLNAEILKNKTKEGESSNTEGM